MPGAALLIRRLDRGITHRTGPIEVGMALLATIELTRPIEGGGIGLHALAVTMGGDPASP